MISPSTFLPFVKKSAVSLFSSKYTSTGLIVAAFLAFNMFRNSDKNEMLAKVAALSERVETKNAFYSSQAEDMIKREMSRKAIFDQACAVLASKGSKCW